MPDIASSIMAELKSATREQHEAAESLVGFDAAIGDPLSYRRLLEKF
jgi:heme oxygenase